MKAQNNVGASAVMSIAANFQNRNSFAKG